MVEPRPYAAFRDTPLWNAVAGAVAELEATREISVATAHDYVIGYVCQELVARKVVAAAALADAP
jgi:hypothetical protein